MSDLWLWLFLYELPWKVMYCVTSCEEVKCDVPMWIQLLSKGLNNTIHISTVHVKSLFLKRSTWRGILHRFMRGRNPLDVRFVSQYLLKRLKWNNILNKFMRKKSYSQFVSKPTSMKSLHIISTLVCTTYLPFCNIDVTP